MAKLTKKSVYNLELTREELIIFGAALGNTCDDDLRDDADTFERSDIESALQTVDSQELYDTVADELWPTREESL